MMEQRDVASDIASNGDLGAPSSDGHVGARDRGDTLLAISNALVKLHKRYFGKGPTRARTLYQGDVVVCIMRGGLTTAEKTLLEAGREGVVYQHRHEYQQAVKDVFIEAIEEIVGRKVLAFMSANHLDPAVLAEVFVLESERGGSGDADSPY